MTDTDTVELVAKAMAASHTLDWDEMPAKRRYRFRDYARAAIAALPPAVPDEADLDERMKAAGMIPLSEMLESHGPMEKWMRHADVRTFQDFVSWVKMKQREYMTMRMRYEIGERDKDDDLYEWAFAHAAVFDGIATQLRAITTPDPVAEAAKVLLDSIPNPTFDNLKPVLMGEFGVTVEGCDEDGEECHYIEPIGWTTIKDILSMALRALTKDGEAG